MVVFVVSDKIRRFRGRLDESLGVEPFREFNVPIFAGVDKTIDALSSRRGTPKNLAYSGKR